MITDSLSAGPGFRINKRQITTGCHMSLLSLSNIKQEQAQASSHGIRRLAASQAQLCALHSMGIYEKSEDEASWET